ncbi:MAG: division/cell wall cluster transcriptional repressor MraZ [Clostridiales Family XIII bacterium]|jgi:MraZ protein|nr:division/cell wall cluster transcriptional repressor MraZ [Clostridiales Family XIII bacterium]
MFFGTYLNSIDDKGRCMIPAKLRYGLGDDCILTLGPDKNIRVYTEDEHDRFLREHILNRPMEDKNARLLQDFYTSNAQRCSIDKQGRINLPSIFIDYAGILKDTVTVGNADHISIWSRERYDAERNPLTVDVGALFAEMLKYADGQ